MTRARELGQRAKRAVTKSIHKSIQESEVPALFGKVYDDGTVTLRGSAASGDRLPRNKVYARLYSIEAGAPLTVVAWCTSVSPVANGGAWLRKTLRGEWEVVRQDAKIADLLFGEYAPDFATPAKKGVSANLTNGRDLLPGRCQIWVSGTLQVNAREFAYTDAVGDEQRYVPTTDNLLDLSGYVPAASGGVSQRVWVRVSLNRATGELEAFTGTAASVSAPLDESGWLDLGTGDGYLPLDAVYLVTGDSDERTVTESRWRFGRHVFDGAGAGSASALDSLTDVDVSTTPPNDGEALIYDSGDSLWKPGAAASGVHNHTDAASGGQLTDAALSAAVGIAKGGTGETTAADAFDALSPLTTKGDLIVRNSTTNTRLAVGANNRVLVADSAQPTGLKWSDALLALTKVTSGAFGGQVRNESGATANEGDVGYLDYDTNYGTVYKTTTTAYFDPSRVCVVLTAGSNGSTIYVTQKASYVGVNYTGTAPNAGEFLVTSTTAGQAQRQTTMRPRIFAVCLSAGSSGTVAAMLLTRTQRVTFDPTDDVLRVENHSDTAFTSTISGAPTATTVVYGAIASGAENVIAPSANTQLGKMRLWNTTRNSYRLIRSVNTATNTITTVSSTDTWANGDSITILSQTTSAGTAADYIEVDLSQTTEIPLLARSLDLQAIARDTGAGSQAVSFHPYLTYDSAKVINTFTPSANVFTGQVFPADLYNRVFTFRSASSGSGTKTSAFKVLAYNIAVP